MPYVYVEEEPAGGLLGWLIMIAIAVALARWEFEAFVTLLPGILAFLATTFVMCTGIIRLGRRICADGRLDDLRDAGLNPFGSVDRAAYAVLSSLPMRLGRCIDRPSAAASEALLVAGLGGLASFGLSCYATGALSTWQHTGRWSPTAPLLLALLGSGVVVYGGRAARRRLDRAYPKRPRVELLDRQPPSVLDPVFDQPRPAIDEVA